MAFFGSISPQSLNELRRRVGGVSISSPPGDGPANFWATDSSLTFVDADGGITAILDGCVHNLDELQQLIGNLHLLGAICAAYRKWGSEFVSWLRGDFSLAIVDPVNDSVLLTRDITGRRPLFYCIDGDRFYFSTGLRHLPRRELDYEHVAGWLLLAPGSETSTFFRDIQTVPLGSTVVWRSNRTIEVSNYWDPSAIPQLRLRDYRDYVEELRSVLTIAVRDRVAGSEARIGAQLSGGLDSSSVVALAAIELASRSSSLIAYTAVPETEPNSSSSYPGRFFLHEGQNAAALAGLYANVHHRFILNRSKTMLESIDTLASTEMKPVLNPQNAQWLYGMYAEARSQGIDTMLTGASGNLTISYDGSTATAALLQERRYFTLLRHLRERHRQGAGWKEMTHSIFGPLVSPRARRLYRKLRRAPQRRLEDISAISAELLQRTGRSSQSANEERNFAHRYYTDSRKLRMAAFARGDLGTHIAAVHDVYGVQLVDPTTDRRVIEFCLSIPDECFCHRGMPRSLLRDAMKDLLPDAVRLERRRGLQGADYHASLLAERDSILDEIRLMEKSSLASACLDVSALRQLMETLPSADASMGWKMIESYMLKFPRGLSMGRFLRRFEDGSL
jgi:asparagine synthase (glutamine-hydrolysing)